jgi:hypothetical protein
MKNFPIALVSGLALVGLLGPQSSRVLDANADLLETHATEAELVVADVFDAQLTPPSPQPIRNLALARHLLELCEEHELEPAFVLSLIEVESHFRAEAISPAGAVGLMQLMPTTAGWVASRLGLDPAVASSEGLKDPFVNLTLGVAYFAELRRRYSEFPTSHALAAYNLGPGRVDQLKLLEMEHPLSVQKYSLQVQRGVYKFRRLTLKGVSPHV